jgi:hypothetical protein
MNPKTAISKPVADQAGGGGVMDGLHSIFR